MQKKAEPKAVFSFSNLSGSEYQEVLLNAPMGVYASTATGRFLAVNPAMAKMFGSDSPRSMVDEITNLAEQLFPDPGEVYRLMRLVDEQGEVMDYETCCLRKDGSSLWVSLNVQAIRDEQGNILHYLGFVTDISGRKDADEALRTREEQLRLITDNSTDVIWTMTTDGQFTYVSPAITKLSGHSRDEFLKVPLQNHIVESYVEPVMTEIANQLAMSPSERVQSLQIELQQYCKDGSIKDIEVSTSWMLDDHGEPVGIQGTTRDISERKRLEEEREVAIKSLEESEAKYRLLTDSMNDMVWVADLDLKPHYRSPSVEKILGFTPEERNAMTLEEMITPASRAIVRAELEKELHREEEGDGDPNRTTTIVAEFYHKDGSTRWLESLASGIRDDKGLLAGIHGVSRDITDRIKAQAERESALTAIRASEERYRLVVENINEVVWTYDLSSRSFTYLSPSVERVLGFAVESVRGMTLEDMHPPETVRRLRRVYEKLVAGGYPGDRVIQEAEQYRADGTIVRVEENSVVLRDEQGLAVTLLGTTRDISGRHRAEQALRESEERYRLLMEEAPVGFSTLDATGIIQYVNRKIEELSGYTRQELEGRNGLEAGLFSEATWQILAHRLGLRLAGETPEPDSIQVELTAKDGTRKWIELHSTVQLKKGVPLGVQNVIVDITERIEAEEEREKLKKQLGRAQKLESIGTLAGGIAHDFNNLLVGIQGHASLMMNDLDPLHPHHVRLKHIEEQVKSASDLTAQLLGFARGGRYEVVPTNLNDVVKKTSTMFGRTKKEIVIHRKYGKNLWNVEVDRTQMEQVFINLYVNAWHAMPGGGDIFLATRNTHLDAEQIPDLVPGKYVVISVSDTGVGMDARTMERIFDPFFTTKEMRRGTGLGLATVYGIIKSHGGHIDVTSEPGRGATFEIYLPATEKDAVREEPGKMKVQGGTETILLVDDEPMVLDVAMELLQSLGYHVHCASNGRDAETFYREMKDTIDLVILDMVMPGMSGSETFDHLRAINPKQKVLLSSGYSINGSAREILDRGCDGFLQKPFRLEDLGGQVREVLNRQLEQQALGSLCGQKIEGNEETT